MISNRAKALLHVAKAELDLDDDLYHEILRQEAGVVSSKDLDPAGLERVMKRLATLGFSAKSKKKPEPRKRRERLDERRPNDLITGSQQKIIEYLFEDLGWYGGERRMGFSHRVIKRPWPQTRAEANKLIEGLKAMLKRQRQAE